MACLTYHVTQVAKSHPELVGITIAASNMLHVDRAAGLMSLALQGCAALEHLHLVLEEWPFGTLPCVGAIKPGRILGLEQAAAASVESHMLYELGPHVQILRLLGGAASRSFVEEPDWKEFLTTLFATLNHLECFETTRDARALVHSASVLSREEVPAEFCDDLMMLKFWHLYVVVDRHSSRLRGVLRSKDKTGLLHDAELK